MKKWIIQFLSAVIVFLAAVSIPIPALAADPVLLTGTFRTASSGLFNGSIVFRLPFAGATDTLTGALVSPAQVRYPIVNGALPANAQLIPNTIINPFGTFYMAALYDQAGALLSVHNVYLSSNSSPFNVTAALASTITTNQVSYWNPSTGIFGTGSPASQITLPTPQLVSGETGTSASRVTSMNVNTPDEYFSRWDASTNANCAAGLLDACLAPIVRIDGTNGGLGTVDVINGLLVNLWGFQGVTPSGQNGGSAIGIGVAVFDKAAETGNTDIRGANFNVGVQGVASQIDRSGFTRSIVPVEDDFNNLSGADCVYIATTGSGNYCVGHTVVMVGPNHGTVAFKGGTSSGTSGIGWLAGYEISGVKNHGYGVFQGNNMNPTVGYYSAGGGTYGFFSGAQTYTPAHNTTETEVNPTIAYLADSTVGANANSLPMVYRAFAADTSHINEWKTWATNANTAYRISFGSNCTVFPCPSYTDMYALTSVGQSLQAGDNCFDNQGTLGSGTGNQCLHSSVTPTGFRQINTPDGNSSIPLPASLVTTAAASDNVAIQGMTSSGHCTFSARNASAATNIATTFISALGANSITVSHAVTANMNYDILCTSN